MIDRKDPRKYCLPHGLNDANLWIVWSATEFLMAIMICGLMMCFGFVLSAFFAAGFVLWAFNFLKTRGADTVLPGASRHLLWRYSVLITPDMAFFPKPTVTRIET